MDNEMIERVAEAMWKTDKWHSKFQDIKETSTLYPKKLEFIDQAKAAIKAMRAPTEKMIETGSLAIAADLNTEAVWRNMVDSILK